MGKHLWWTCTPVIGKINLRPHGEIIFIPLWACNLLNVQIETNGSFTWRASITSCTTRSIATTLKVRGKRITAYDFKISRTVSSRCIVSSCGTNLRNKKANTKSSDVQENVSRWSYQNREKYSPRKHQFLRCILRIANNERKLQSHPTSRLKDATLSSRPLKRRRPVVVP